MTKRPHIPLSVRVQVAERQCAVLNDTFWKLYQSRVLLPTKYPLKDRLEALLYHLFGDEKPHLDHDPALVLRTTKRNIWGEVLYYPIANDPNHLVYRTKLEHREKTIGRKQDAEKTVTTKGSDAWLAGKFRRLSKPKRKSTLKSRPFPKAKRPFRSKHV